MPGASNQTRLASPLSCCLSLVGEVDRKYSQTLWFTVINKVDPENIETPVPSVHSVVLFVLLIKNKACRKRSFLSFHFYQFDKAEYSAVIQNLWFNVYGRLTFRSPCLLQCVCVCAEAVIHPTFKTLVVMIIQYGSYAGWRWRRLPWQQHATAT